MITTLFRLAAAFCFGVAQNDPFVDGSIRAAFLAAVLVRAVNGRLQVDPMEAASAVLGVAEGSIDEGAQALWLERHCIEEKS